MENKPVYCKFPKAPILHFEKIEVKSGGKKINGTIGSEWVKFANKRCNGIWRLDGFHDMNGYSITCGFKYKDMISSKEHKYEVKLIPSDRFTFLVPEILSEEKKVLFD